MSKFLMLSTLLLGVIYCKPAPVEQGSEVSAVLQAANSEVFWPSRDIPVCWEKIGDDFRSDWDVNELKKLVQDSVTREYKRAQINFQGWYTCKSDDEGIRIEVSSSRGPQSYVGYRLNGIRNGLRLPFDYKFARTNEDEEVFCEDPIVQEICIETDALHEFMHAMGFVHGVRDFMECHPNEDNLGTGGDLENGIRIGNPDPDSIVSYCREKQYMESFARTGVPIRPKLSDGDIASLKTIFDPAWRASHTSNTQDKN